MQQDMTDAQAKRFEAAKKMTYFIGLPEDWPNVTNLFYRWCGYQKQTCVYAIKNRKNYTVELDTASCAYNMYKLTPEGMTLADSICRSLEPYGCEFLCCREIVRIEDVPPLLIDLVCQALFIIGRDFREDRKQRRTVWKILEKIDCLNQSG